MSIGGVVTRHRAVVFVGLVVAGIAVLTYLTIASGRRGTKAVAPAGASTSTVPGAAGELLGLVRRGQGSNIDIAYTGATPSPFTAHLWRRGPLARLDNETGSGNAAMASTQLVTASGPVSCTRTGSAPWSCAPKPGLKVGDLGVVSPALVNTLSGLDVKVHDERVLGQSVRCFTVADAATATTVTAGGAQMCLTSDGIPVRVDAGPVHLEAVSLDRGRPADSVFRPPGS
ncbi:MAG: hypothetical protein M3256_07465 [Actinomycetota bacterium]|nr:hypothetical protein [Actinomycetota bacterium]